MKDLVCLVIESKMTCTSSTLREEVKKVARESFNYSLEFSISFSLIVSPNRPRYHWTIKNLKYGSRILIILMTKPVTIVAIVDINIIASLMSLNSLLSSFLSFTSYEAA
jgi:hypothetical protein